MSLANDVNAFSHNSILLGAAFILPMAGAYRLARFNIDKEQASYFKGVPIPMIGLLTASFPLIYWQASWFSQILLTPIVWFSYVLLSSFLMVMTRPMLALKGLGQKPKLYLPIAIIVLEIAVTAVFYRWMAVPFGFLGYCIVSLLYKKTITQ